VIVLANLVGI